MTAMLPYATAELIAEAIPLAESSLRRYIATEYEPGPQPGSRPVCRTVIVYGVLKSQAVRLMREAGYRVRVRDTRDGTCDDPWSHGVENTKSHGQIMG